MRDGKIKTAYTKFIKKFFVAKIMNLIHSYGSFSKEKQVVLIYVLGYINT